MGKPDAIEPESEKKLPTRFVISRVISYLKPSLHWLILASVCSLITSGLTLAVPLLVGMLVDTAANQVALFLVGVLIVRGLAQSAATLLFTYGGERIVLTLRLDVFKHLLSLSLDYFERRRVGELASRVSSDAGIIQSIGSTFVVDAARQSISLVGALVIVTVREPSLALVLLCILPGIALITFGCGPAIRRASRSIQDTLASANAQVTEALFGIETVKCFGREDLEKSRFMDRLRGTYESALRLAFANARYNLLVQLFFVGGLGAMIWYAAKLIEANELTSGKLIEFVGYALLAGRSFAGLTNFWTRWQRLLGAGRSVFQIFLESPTVAERPDPIPFDGSHELIEFTNVRFTYPMNPDREVLLGLNFSATRGQMIALVGESGAGKSTVILLLQRLFDVTSGSICIDGRDVRDLNLTDYRNSISVVPQDIVVFGRTLRENITYGKPGANDDEVEEAARAAHATEFISSTSKGLDTIAGERGVILSGGEKQRIAIARAMLKDPAILILDEATSSLDNRSEALVKDALATLMKGRTTFVIAHRLSTIERADRVLVLHEGELVESGTHRELLARGEHYARLHRVGALRPE